MGILTGNNVHDSMVKKSMRSAIRHIHLGRFSHLPCTEESWSEERRGPYQAILFPVGCDY